MLTLSNNGNNTRSWPETVGYVSWCWKGWDSSSHILFSHFKISTITNSHSI